MSGPTQALQIHPDKCTGCKQCELACSWLQVGPTAAVSSLNDVGMLKGLIQIGVALGPWKAYLEENPLDLRRVFVASGASRALLDWSLLSGRVSGSGGYRAQKLPPVRGRSRHHATLVSGAPR